MSAIGEDDVKMMVNEKDSVNFEAKYLDEEASYDSAIQREDRGLSALSFWCRVQLGASALNVSLHNRSGHSPLLICNALRRVAGVYLPAHARAAYTPSE